MVDRRHWLITGCLGVLLLFFAQAATASGGIEAGTTHGGTVVNGMSRSELQGLGGTYYRNVAAVGPFHEYAVTSYCTTEPPGGANSGDICTQSWSMCQSGRNASGPAMRVWQREVQQDGTPVTGANWVQVGFTCLPDEVPGAGNVLTMALIVQQFRNTAFAVPGVSTQPVGNATLVNLPTFYQVVWPATGFKPDDIDATTIIGHAVDIQPTLSEIVYDFGDGNTSGPTTSLGGTYPNGDVRHTYSSKATVNVAATITYGGRFRVNGGDWIVIPDTVTITGTPQPLDILEARARLVTH